MQEIKDQYSYIFSENNKPALIVDDGAIVKFYTRDCFNGEVNIENYVHVDLNVSNCNPVTSPLYVNNAFPNDILKVTIIKIEIDNKGVVVNYPSCGG